MLLEEFFGARLRAVEGDNRLKLALQNRFGRFIGQSRAEDEYLRLLLHVLGFHRVGLFGDSGRSRHGLHSVWTHGSAHRTAHRTGHAGIGSHAHAHRHSGVSGTRRI